MKTITFERVRELIEMSEGDISLFSFLLKKLEEEGEEYFNTEEK